MPGRTAAHAILKALPDHVWGSAIICPLCGTAAPSSGLRATSDDEGVDSPWQLIFACPACGLLTNFDVEQVTPQRLEALHGSPWGRKLRAYRQRGSAAALRRPQARGAHFAAAFGLSLLTWLVLIGNLKPIEVLWGAAVSLAVARFTYRGMAFDYFSWAFKAGRWAALGRLLLAFVRQLVAQNVSLALRVFRPSLPIRPGIVAVPTSLRSAGQLSLLASLMSLTPDTLTMDIDREAGLIYVHWIDVRATEPEEARRLISADLEARIKAWLG